MKIEKLDAAGYRKFGLMMGAVIAVLWPWILTAIFVLVALVFPIALQPVYFGWMRFGLVMNWINTRLILGLLFYGIFLPIGLFFKLIGRDAMHRKFDKKMSSYRHIDEHNSSDNMEHPY